MNHADDALEHYVRAIEIDTRAGVDDASAAAMIANIAFVYCSVRLHRAHFVVLR
jgi:hypothetical protein